MLIKKNFKNQFESTYICDRCGKKVDVKHKIGISTQRYLTNSKKYCDLCFNCFRALDRGIKKGKKNENRRTY